MSKKRIHLDTDEETIRRLELAAQKHNVAVTTYCLTAIQQQLEEDGIEAETSQKQFQEVITQIRELQKRILRERNGKPVDVIATHSLL